MLNFFGVLKMLEDNVQQDPRIRFARDLILQKKNITLQQLFKIIPRKVIAENLGLNVNGYLNVRSKEPENFKLRELKKFGKVFDLDLHIVVDLFNRSILPENTNTDSLDRE